MTEMSFYLRGEAKSEIVSGEFHLDIYSLFKSSGHFNLDKVFGALGRTEESDLMRGVPFQLEKDRGALFLSSWFWYLQEATCFAPSPLEG